MNSTIINPQIPVCKRIKQGEGLDPLVKVNAAMEKAVDSAMVSLFDAMQESFGSTFRLRGKTVAQGRSVVSSWQPHVHADHDDTRAFRVPYVSSAFFDRYISVEELPNQVNLQAKAAKKFLDICTEGAVLDAYIFNHEELKPLIDKMRYHMECILGEFNLLDIYENCKHGPNSTESIPFSNAYLHVKAGDIRGTRASLQQLKHYLTWDHTLRDVLCFMSDELRAFINGTEVFSDSMLVDFTQQSFVPKSFEALRSMCPEATIPAFFAQGVASVITSGLERVNISLSTQPNCHRLLSKLASLHPELGIATIDWSEASDRLWMPLIQAVLTEGDGPKWYDFMTNVCRCESTRIKFSGVFSDSGLFPDLEALTSYVSQFDDAKIKVIGNKKNRFTCVVTTRVPMIGTMGNPITFPLQTALFYSFLTACTELEEERYNTDFHNQNKDYEFFQPVSSFGDDGIIDSRCFHVVKHFAKIIGWKLNPKKSYVSGGFRESCGGDYFRGRWCRPVQMKRPPTDSSNSPKQNGKIIQAWLYVAANAACDLVQSFGYSINPIDKWLVQQHAEFKLGKVCVVPPSFPDGSGLRIVDSVGPLMGPKYLYYHCGVKYGLMDNIFHVPYWDDEEGGFVFRRISSVPPRDNADDDRELPYYHKALKGSSKREELSSEFNGFLDVDFKSEAQLAADGTLPMRIRRFHKVKAVCLSWL